MLQSMGSQRVGHNRVTELNSSKLIETYYMVHSMVFSDSHTICVQHNVAPVVE